MPRLVKTFLEVPLSVPTVTILRVSLLGGLRVERPGEAAATRFQTQKTAALLAYLALHSGRAHGREFLTDLFWPDAAFEKGSRSLRTALSSLRRQLEPPGTPMGTILIADRTTIRLNNSNVETDVAHFEAACLAETADTPALEESRLEAALAWYGGPLLPGFYEEWAEGMRERLADLFRDLLLRRAALAEQRGGWGVALDYARRAVHLEKDRAASGTEVVFQPAHIAVIRLLTRMGRTDEARGQYDLLARRLHDICDEAPSPDAHAALSVAPAPKEIALEAATNDVGGNAALIADAPSALSVVPTPPRLPIPLTRFFGRGPERDQLASAFAEADCRLVTLTGPGGTGKTRLALEWARHESGSSSACTCFVPLADLGQANYLWAAIAQALALERLPDPGAVRAQVCAALNEMAQSGPPLLVLDNFEEWVDGGAPLVESLLQAVPGLRVVVTSRRRLSIGGEREIPVGPLPVPTLPGTPERLLEWASVQLFVNRAQSARPDFQMTPRNGEAIAALCQRLDGVPLALELTAAWAGAMSPAQMLARVSAQLLDEAGPPLAHQRAQRPARHRTLRAALDTSVELLSPDLQTAFACLSVFRGGWTLEAAEGILSGLSVGTADVLARLRERSLLVAEASPDGESLRFRLLPVLREYADEALRGKAREIVQCAHAAYFLHLAKTREPQMDGPNAKMAIDTLETEHDNIRAALGYLLGPGHAHTDEGLRLAKEMMHFWILRGYWDEGASWLNRALDQCRDDGTQEVLRAHLLRCKGRIAYEKNEYDVTRAVYEEALTIWRKRNDEPEIATLLQGLAGVAFHSSNDYKLARTLTEESLALWREQNDRAGIATSLLSLSVVAYEQGDYANARHYVTECIEIERELNRQENLANALFSLGNAAYSQDAFDEAQTLFEESLQIQQSLGYRQRIGHCLLGLGNVASAHDDYLAARDHYEDALRIARELGDQWATAMLLNNTGRVAFYLNDFVSARILCGECLEMRIAMGDRAGVARVLESLAQIAAAQVEEHARSATLWGAAHALRTVLTISVAVYSEGEYRDCIAELKATLGDTAFDAAWARGAAFAFDDVIAFATQ